MTTSDSPIHCCYNAQTVVDEDTKVILNTRLVPSAAGSCGLAETLVAAGIEQTPDTLLADARYFSEDNVTACTEAGIDPLIATGRHRHSEKAPAAPRGRIPKSLTPKQRTTRELRTRTGSAAYARRKTIVEPVFGQMKTAQHAGRLRLRGLENAQGNWSLQALCHKVRKLRLSGYHWVPLVELG